MTILTSFLDRNGTFLRACLNDAAAMAGRMILEWGPGAVSVKGDCTPVTEADVRINKRIIRQLCSPSTDSFKNNFMDKLGEVDVIGEEISERREGADWQLVIDPVDGTIPFVMGIPSSTVLITLCYEWEPQIAVVYDPHTDTKINAAKGHGVYGYNRRRAKVTYPNFVNQTPAGQKPMIGVEVWPESDYEWLPDALPGLINAGFNIQILNSIGRQHMSLIQGHLVAVIFVKSDIDDVLPGHLATCEMGGVASDLYGETLDFPSRKMHGSVLSDSLITHSQVLRILERARE